MAERTRLCRPGFALPVSARPGQQPSWHCARVVTGRNNGRTCFVARLYPAIGYPARTFRYRPFRRQRPVWKLAARTQDCRRGGGGASALGHGKKTSVRINYARHWRYAPPRWQYYFHPFPDRSAQSLPARSLAGPFSERRLCCRTVLSTPRLAEPPE